jgi:hypothetical protein
MKGREGRQRQRAAEAPAFRTTLYLLNTGHPSNCAGSKRFFAANASTLRAKAGSVAPYTETEVVSAAPFG